MNKYIRRTISLLVMSAVMIACDKEEGPSVTPSARGTVEDDEGNVYEWVRIGTLDWTTSNALNGTPMYEYEVEDEYDGWIYAFGSSERTKLQEEYLPEFGNLLSYEDAVNSAPAGWRLPSDEDWKNLERSLGMGRDADDIGWRGKKVADLMRQGEEGTGLNLLMGGCVMNSSTGFGVGYGLFHEKEYGYYWTSTQETSNEDIQQAYYRKICYGIGAVERRFSKTDKLMSVRYVRDAK